METKGNEGVKFSYYEIVLWHQLGWGRGGGVWKQSQLTTLTLSLPRVAKTEIHKFSNFPNLFCNMLKTEPSIVKLLAKGFVWMVILNDVVHRHRRTTKTPSLTLGEEGLKHSKGELTSASLGPPLRKDQSSRQQLLLINCHGFNWGQGPGVLTCYLLSRVRW